MRFGPLLAALVTLCLVGPLAAEDSIDQLAGYAERIEKGVNASLSGTDPAEAFGSWTAVANSDALAEMTKAGATGARFVAMEFEIVLRKDGRDVYGVRTLVHVSEGKAALLKLDGKAFDEDGAMVTYLPLDALTGDAEPLAGAARALATLLAGPEDVPVVETPTLESLIPFAPAREELAKGTKEAASRMARVKEEVRALGEIEIGVRVDDAPCIILGANGEGIGILKSELDIEEDGKIAIALARFRAFPPAGKD